MDTCNGGETKSVEEIPDVGDSRKDFTLVMHGTSCEYNSQTKKKVIEGKEVQYQDTLSVVFDVIDKSNPNPEETDTEQPINFKYAAILNGTGPLAINVHKIIKKGAVKVLQAISRGQTDINLIGFSRGAVSAVHVAHLLDFIKISLTSGAEEFRTECPNSYWSDYSGLLYFIENNEIEYNEQLKDYLRQIKIRMFLVDPVPGGRSWESDLHYCIPDTVDKCMVVVAQHENSGNFYMSWIDADPKKVEYLLMPGYHASFNRPFSHNSDSDKYNDVYNRRDVQYVVFYEILSFLETNRVKLVDTITKDDYYLKDIYNQYKLFSKEEKISLIFETYNAIVGKLDYYRLLRTSNYILMFNTGIYNARLVLTKELPYVRLTDKIKFNVLDTCNSFINNRHIALAFKLLIGSSVAELESDDLSGEHLKLINYFISGRLDVFINLLGEDIVESSKVKLIKLISKRLTNSFLTSPNLNPELIENIRFILENKLYYPTQEDVDDNQGDVDGIQEDVVNIEEAKNTIIEELKSTLIKDIKAELQLKLYEYNSNKKLEYALIIAKYTKSLSLLEEQAALFSCFEFDQKEFFNTLYTEYYSVNNLFMYQVLSFFVAMLAAVIIALALMALINGGIVLLGSVGLVCGVAFIGAGLYELDQNINTPKEKIIDWACSVHSAN